MNDWRGGGEGVRGRGSEGSNGRKGARG